MATPAGTPTITSAQRRAIFAAARAHGLHIGDIHEMTPNDSISKMTRAEASTVLNNLNRGTAHARVFHCGPPKRRRPRPRPGTIRMATPEQAELTGKLMSELCRIWGWDSRKMTDWIASKHYRRGGSMLHAMTSAEAAEKIELLKRVRTKAIAAATNRQRSAARACAT